METEELKAKLEKELNSLTSTRGSLDAILKDMHRYIDVVVDLDKRVRILEDKIEELLVEEAITEMHMYA